jgi:MFS family permease
LGGFVVPFLTLYLTEKLKMNIEIIGIIVTISSLLIVTGSILGGMLADKVGRKKTYILAQTTSALTLIPCAFIENPSIIIFLILISTFFNGAVRPALNALVVDLLPPDKRNAGFSLEYLGINIGAAFGPMIAGFLFNNHLKLFFLGDSLTSLIVVCIALIYIEETKSKVISENLVFKEKKESGSTLQAILKRPKIVIFLFIYIIYDIAYTQSNFSLPLQLNKIYASKISEIFGLLTSINAFTVILLTLVITNLTKKNSSLMNISMAGVFYALGFGMIGITHYFPLLVVSTVLWTMGEILTCTNISTYLANNSPANFRARFSALTCISWAIGATLGTSVMSKYIHLMGINAVWTLIFVLSIIASFFILMLNYSDYLIKAGRACLRHITKPL